MSLHGQISGQRRPFHEVEWHDLGRAVKGGTLAYNDAQVVDFARQTWRHRSPEQVRAELLGEQAAAWCNGDQYLFTTGGHGQDGGGYRVEPLPNPHDRLRLVFNMFGPHFEQWVARMSLDGLEPEAVPTTGSQEDLDATRLQTAVLRYYRDRLDLAGLKDAFIRQIGLDGTGFTKVCWDPLAGSEFPVSRAELKRWNVKDDVLSSLLDAPGSDEALLHTGEPVIENVPLANLTWGPVGVQFDEAEYVVEARERSIGYVCARWGLKPQDVQADYGDASERWYRGAFDGRGSVVYRDPNAELVVTYEIWAPRSAAHPQGLHAVIIGDQVVNRRRNKQLINPYAHGRVPYVNAKTLNLPQQALGKTPAWDMFIPQAMINKLASQIMENIELFANPRLWVQDNEVIDEWELTSRPGGIHRYRHRVPEVMPGVELPTAMYAVFDRWIRVLQETIGIHDVSLGRAPAQGRSGRYVIALQDADNTRMSATLRAVNRWASDMLRLLLCVVRQYVSEERLIAVRGADNVWERRAFRGAQLTAGSDVSGPEAFNVVLRTSGQARSRAAQIELVTMLIQFGLYDVKKPEDVREVRTILEIGDVTTRMDPDQGHRDLQRRVHEVLITGRYVKPEYYHNHEVRLDELRRFMNTPDFAAQPPAVKALFARYERDTIGLQATRKLETEEIVRQSVAEFQRTQGMRRALDQFGQLEAAAPPAEQPAVGRMLANPRSRPLLNFLSQAA